MTTKDLLMNSAKEILAENGYSNTKIEDITKNANLAKGTFYIYFKTKEDLMIEIISEYSTNFKLFTDNIKLEGNLKKNIHNLVKSLFVATNTHPNAVKVILIIFSNSNVIKKITTEHKDLKIIAMENFIMSILNDAKDEVDEEILKNDKLLLGPIDMFIKFFLLNSFDIQKCPEDSEDIKKLNDKDLNDRVETITNFLYKAIKK